MFRFSTWAALAAVALVLGTTGDASAQRGGHSGGAHYSGGGAHYSGGGAHYSGGGAHYSGGYGGYNHGGYGGYNHGGYYNHSGFGSGFGYGLGVGVGLGVFSGGYNSYGRGYGYGGYYDSYAPTVIVGSSPTPTIIVNSEPAVQTTQSAYYTPASTENKARLLVRVPADASVWVDGNATTQTGTDREFLTPSLTPDTTYSYQLKARWMQDGQPVERVVKVDVRANQTTPVDFVSGK